MRLAHADVGFTFLAELAEREGDPVAEGYFLCEALQFPAHLDYSPSLDPEDFCVPAHRALYVYASHMRESGEPGVPEHAADFLQALIRRGEIPALPIHLPVREFVFSIYNAHPIADNGKPTYVRTCGARILAAKALREARAACADGIRAVEESGLDPTHDAATILTSTADRIMRSVASMNDEPEDTRALRLQTIARLEAGERPPSLYTGLYELDRVLGGLQPSELFVLAGLQGHGKTALALQIALNVARAGKRVGVFSLEMSASQIVERLLCNSAEVSGHGMRRGLLTPDEKARLHTRGEEIDRILIDDSPQLTGSRVQAKALAWKMREGLDLVIVDHLQLLGSDNPKAGEYERVSEASRGMKLAAKAIGVPLIALSQLNREAVKTDQDRPKLRHLRASGTIEQDADQVALLYLDERSGDAMEVDVAKNRSGPGAGLRLATQLEFFRILDPSHEAEILVS